MAASSDSEDPAPREAQRRFTLLRLRFNSIICQFDIFADVLAQRSEHETGVWVAGLDDVAADALELPGYYTAPPVICYLYRGHGAAIRRARTRLPGGDLTPVVIISVPRERMVGSGVGFLAGARGWGSRGRFVGPTELVKTRIAWNDSSKGVQNE